MARLDPELVRQARLDWLAGRSAQEIATRLKVRRFRIYDWSYRFQWPKRPPQVVRPDGRLIAMCGALWLDGVSRTIIAVLAGLPVKTLDDWRKRYGWAKRKPGRRPAPVQDPAIQQAMAQLRAHRQMREARQREASQQERQRQQTKNLRWRCDCSPLTIQTGLQCPTCQQLHPLIHAA